MSSSNFAILKKSMLDMLDHVEHKPSPIKKVLWIYFSSTSKDHFLNSDKSIWLGIKTKYLEKYSPSSVKFKKDVAELLKSKKHESKHEKCLKEYSFIRSSYFISCHHNKLTIEFLCSNEIILPLCPLKSCTNKVNNTSFVDAQFGNDKTAQPENGDCPYRTIQKAIDSIPHHNNQIGWLIVVRPGIYKENLIILSKVSIEGAGPTLTLIQGTVKILGQGGNQLSGLKLISRIFPTLTIDTLKQLEDVYVRELLITNFTDSIESSNDYRVISLNQVNPLAQIRLEEVNLQNDLTNFPSLDANFTQLYVNESNVRLNDLIFSLIGHPQYQHSFISSDTSRVQHHGGFATLNVSSPQKNNLLFQATDAITHSQQDVLINATYLDSETDSECFIYYMNQGTSGFNSQMQVSNPVFDLQVPQERLTLAHSNALSGLLNILSGGFVGPNRDVPKITGFTENIYYWVNSTQGSGTNKAGGYSNIRKYSELFGTSMTGTPQLNQNTILMDVGSATLNLPLDSPSILNGKQLTVKNISSANVLINEVEGGILNLEAGQSATLQANNLLLGNALQVAQNPVQWVATSVTQNTTSAIVPQVAGPVYQCNTGYVYQAASQMAGDTYKWTILNGDAQIIGSDTGPTVTINAGANNFTLQLIQNGVMTQFVQNVTSPLQANLLFQSLSPSIFGYTVYNAGNVAITDITIVSTLTGLVTNCSESLSSLEGNSYVVCTDQGSFSQNTATVTGNLPCVNNIFTSASVETNTNADDFASCVTYTPSLSAEIINNGTQIEYTYNFQIQTNPNICSGGVNLILNVLSNLPNLVFNGDPTNVYVSGGTTTIKATYTILEIDRQRGSITNFTNANLNSVPNGVSNLFLPFSLTTNLL